jgi:hypothetical protein
VGRTANPFGTFKIRLPACPPVMRMQALSGLFAGRGSEFFGIGVR